jgi:hypothetical protein
LQTKLAIGKTGDAYEQEAERVSEEVMRSHEQPGQKHEPLAVRHRIGSTNLEQTAAPQTVHEALRSPGQPLDAATRAFVEARFGYDFSRVRVHSDAEAVPSTSELNAHAYTVGHDIVFGAGQFVPGTHRGRKLIAHELTHVVQQTLPRPPNTHSLPTRPPVAGYNAGSVLQRAPAAAQRTFTPAIFSDSGALLKAILKDNPKEEELVGACRYLDGLPMARTLALVSLIKARKPTAAAALQATALQGWGTSHIRSALAAVMLKGEISRVGFADEHAPTNLDLSVLTASDAGLVLDVLGPAVPELAAMQRTKGFHALRPEEQARLTYLIGGSTSLSAPAPGALRTVLADRRANKDDPATFRKFLTDEKYLQFDVGLPRGNARPRDPFTVGPAVEAPKYAFGGLASLATDAIRRDVVIDARDATGKVFKQTIPVFIPKAGGPKDKAYGIPTINEIAETLAATPDISRSKIVRVEVHPIPSRITATGRGPLPDDEEVHMAASGNGVMNIFPIKNAPHDRASIAGDLIHETGHTASLAARGDSETDQRWEPWRAAMKSDGIAVSQYGKETVDEDFAESWALYARAVDTPREAEVRALIPARCKLMDTLRWQKPRP